MNAAETDHWFEVTRQFDARPNDWLQAEARRLLDMTARFDESKKRIGLDHLPGWGGTQGRPAVGIIRCMLLIRGVQPQF